MSAANPQRVVISWQDGQGDQATGALILDASLNENHSVSAEATTQPVETGSNVADNIRPLPKMLTLEGMITDVPLGVPASIEGVDDVGNQNITGAVKTIQRTVGKNTTVSFKAFQFDSQFTRVSKVYAALMDAIQGNALFSITTTLTTYSNMACINFTVPRNVATGTTLRFTMSFQELRFVDVAVVKALPPKVKPKHRGAKTGKQLEPNDAEEKSFFAASADALHVFGKP